MKELFKRKSTNGRSGLAIVGPDDAEFPARGTVRKLGTVDGVQTWELIPDSSATTWVVIAEDVKVHGGATLAAAMDLQSGNHASIVVLSAQAVVQHYGYKRRSSRTVAYIDGVRTAIPETVLYAMGLLAQKPAEPEVSAPIAEPEPLQGAMAAAFQGVVT